MFMKGGLLMDYLKALEGRYSKMEPFMKEALGSAWKTEQGLESRWNQIMIMITKGLKKKKVESFNLVFFVKKFHEQIYF